MSELSNSDSKQNRIFWSLILLIAAFLALSMSRDIKRPFYGLHSWGDAHRSWDARVHVNYGLGYTKGLAVRVVGADIPEKPYRYLDHPQVGGLLSFPFMYIFDQNEWSMRIGNISLTVLTLLIFAKIARGLTNNKIAIIASMFFAMFPVIGYFGVNMWFYPTVLAALYNYLFLAGYMDSKPEKSARNKIFLAIFLFFAMQISWEGFFFALGIGLHYLCRCGFRKQKPDWGFLSILFFAPVASLLLVCLILIAGRGWDFGAIYKLFIWRAGSGEETAHNWGLWFAKWWEFMRSNFTLPAILLCGFYLLLGRAYNINSTADSEKKSKWNGAFPQFSLFLLIPCLQLFILKGCLWMHQTWLMPFFMLVAIGAAGGICLVESISNKVKKGSGFYIKTLTVGIFVVCAIVGTNKYYSIRHFSARKIDMLKKLNAAIAADKRLLSFESFVVNQHKIKGSFYRPEVAWYLDRDVDVARTLEDIKAKAATGKYPFYLMPVTYYDQKTMAYLTQLSRQLAGIYEYEFIQAEPMKKDWAPMQSYMIFDLYRKK